MILIFIDNEKCSNPHLWWDFEMSDLINESHHYLESSRKWLLGKSKLESPKWKHPHVNLQAIFTKKTYLRDFHSISRTLVIYHFIVYLGFSEVGNWWGEYFCIPYQCLSAFSYTLNTELLVYKNIWKPALVHKYSSISTWQLYTW